MPDYVRVFFTEETDADAAVMNQLDEGIEQAHDTRVKKSGDTMDDDSTIVFPGTASTVWGPRVRKVIDDVLWEINASVWTGRGPRLNLRADGDHVSSLEWSPSSEEWQFQHTLSIDGAPAARVVSGSYTGNGGSSRVISLPFTPVKAQITRAGDPAAPFIAWVDAVKTVRLRSNGDVSHTDDHDGFVTNGMNVGIGFINFNVNGGSYHYVVEG